VLEGPYGLALLGLALLGLAAGTVAGVTSGPLWLDEAISVEIARRPLPALYDGLRQDGAPPLYYLLLKAWTALFGTGTVAVRLLTVLLVPVALLLAHRLGERVAGRAGARAAVTALAALPWTMRYGSEARMYLLVVVLVLAGALALHAVHTTGSRRAVGRLALCVGALLLTHYWSLFLLAGVGLAHLPGLLRRRPAAFRVAVGGLLGGLLFVPWVPTFLFQAEHTGAPWADPLTLPELFRTPRYWGGGSVHWRTVLASLLVPLAVLAAVRAGRQRPAARLAGAVVLLTVLLAWATVYVGGGGYTGRYTAVVVPLVALLVGLGATTLPGRWAPLVALGLVVAVGAASGVPAAAHARTTAGGVATAFRAQAQPGDLLVYCPDQLGPPVARLLGSGYDQVVYPSLGAPQLVDWVDYRARQDAAVPVRVARQLLERAAGRQLFVLAATGYRTFEGDCEGLLLALGDERGAPERLFGEVGRRTQLLYRYDPAP
jgi:hypothetical protein